MDFAALAADGADRGWDGDTMVLARGQDGWAGRAVWVTAWDTPTDRDYFLEKLARAPVGTPSRMAVPHGDRGAVVLLGHAPGVEARAAEALSGWLSAD